MITSGTSTPVLGPCLAHLVGGEGVVTSFRRLLKRKGTRLGMSAETKGTKLGLSEAMELELVWVAVVLVDLLWFRVFRGLSGLV